MTRASRPLVAVFALLTVGALPLVTPADESDPVVETGELDFQVNIEPTSLSVGRRFVVSFTVTYPTGTQAYFPEPPDVSPLVLVAQDRETSPIAGSAGGEVHRLTLLPVRVGTSVLKPIEVPYVDVDGEAGISRTPEVRIQVGSTLGDETNPELAPAGEPVPVRVPNTLLIWALFGLAVAAVAALGGIIAYRAWRRWQDAHRPPPPPRPPLEVALERLALIESRGLAISGEFKELALEVSEVVREFLGGCMGFSGVDMTTYEVMLAVSGKDLGRLTPPELEDFLGFCDLVKFARFVPTPEEAQGLVPRARDLVGRVAPVYPFDLGEGEEEGK